MRSHHAERQPVLDEIIRRFEISFPQSVAVWTGSGSPDEESDLEKIEEIEVYCIPQEDYRRFRDLVWELEKEVARPHGFSIMVHNLTPESTRKYRWDEYQAELRRRKQVVAEKPCATARPAVAATSRTAKKSSHRTGKPSGKASKSH